MNLMIVKTKKCPFRTIPITNRMRVASFYDVFCSKNKTSSLKLLPMMFEISYACVSALVRISSRYVQPKSALHNFSLHFTIHHSCA